MPAGLDGNPNPVVTAQRDSVLDAVVDLVLARQSRRTLVGVLGRSDAGKSTFADELAARIRHRSAAVIRSTTDSFHRPRIERLHRGRGTADGYYLDSHQLDVIVRDLLEPFSRGAEVVRTAGFDEPTDTPVETVVAVPPDAVLVFDGLFLQRPEFQSHWDITVFLAADQRREQEWLDYLLSDLPDDPVDRAAALDTRLERARWPRYRTGWRIYVDADRPAENATIVIDNNNIHTPRIVRIG